MFIDTFVYLIYEPPLGMIFRSHYRSAPILCKDKQKKLISLIFKQTLTFYDWIYKFTPSIFRL